VFRNHPTGVNDIALNIMTDISATTELTVVPVHCGIIAYVNASNTLMYGPNKQARAK